MVIAKLTVLSLSLGAVVLGCSEVRIQPDGEGGSGGEETTGGGGQGGAGGEGGGGGSDCPGPFTPSCDPGDTLVEGGPCPSDAFCYELSVCDVTVLCMDAFPEHGCPATAPIAESACALPDGKRCTYPHEDAACDVFECWPVYPEEGAPSRWVLVDDVCPTWGA